MHATPHFFRFSRGQFLLRRSGKRRGSYRFGQNGASRGGVDFTLGAGQSGTKPGMQNRDRQFIPEWLIVHAGDSMCFPNDDTYYHSIYSVTLQDPFDICYYGTGPRKSCLSSGLIEVRCHIHPSMDGTIIVADGPATSGPVSSISLSDVTAGKHVLYTWSEGASVRAVQITMPGKNRRSTSAEFKGRR